MSVWEEGYKFCVFSLIVVKLEIKLCAIAANIRANILMHIFHFDFTGSFYDFLD